MNVLAAVGLALLAYLFLIRPWLERREDVRQQSRLRPRRPPAPRGPSLFCPECGGEYQPTATECWTCRVPLERRPPPSETPPPPPRPSYVEFVPVFASADVAQISLAATILENAGIPHNAGDESVLFTGRRGAIGVPPECEEEARQLLQGLSGGGAPPLSDPPRDEDTA